MAERALLTVDELVVDYMTPAESVRVINGVSFVMARGDVLGLVGESGSGKSTIAHAIARIIAPPAIIRGRRIVFDGQDVLRMSEDELRAFRWRNVSLVPQNALNSLCPVLTVGEQIIDVIVAHDCESTRAARARTTELLQLVGVDPQRISSYPHELSGGMRQRVAIAMALALHPQLVVMDEPTTALDVVVQHEVLSRIAVLRDKLGTSILFITHDLSIIAQFATHIGVLYAGEMVELGPARELFREPRHPYTQGLLAAHLSVHAPRRKLTGIAGAPPDLRCRPTGCAFRLRCPEAVDRCTKESPTMQALGGERRAACHLLTP